MILIEKGKMFSLNLLLFDQTEGQLHHRFFALKYMKPNMG